MITIDIRNFPPTIKKIAKNFLFVDFETVSNIDLNRGAHLYSMEAIPILLGYAINDGPTQCINLYDGETIPQEVSDLINDPECMLVAFNCDFERLIFHSCFLEYDIPYGKWFDVMFQAREHGLAGSLQTISEVFGSSKLAGGTVELRKMIKLHDYTLNMRRERKEAILKNDLAKLDEIEKWFDKKIQQSTPDMQILAQYCMQDVSETRDRMCQLPVGNYPCNSKEMRLAKITQEMNDRGLPIDWNFVTRAQRAADAAKNKLNAQLIEMTNGVVKTGYQYAAFSKFLTDRFGVGAKISTSAESIEKVKKNAKDPELIALCDVWLSKGTAVSKFDALLSTTHPITKRCYGTLAFCGAARTKRWSGRLYQPQNLKRPDLEPGQIEEMIDLILSELPEDIAQWYTVDELGDGVRACICAHKGKKIIAADLTAIEQRSLMWVINDPESLQLFDDIDNGRSSFDLYQLTYAKSFAVNDPSTVNKDQRFVGKVMALLLQYMGGVVGLYNGIVDGGADLDKFVALVAKNAEVEEIMKAEREYANMKRRLVKNISKAEYAALAVARTRWRNANPRVVDYGAALERAFVSALNNPGFSFAAYNWEEDPHKMVTCTYNKELDFLKMQLPIGALYYPMPRLQVTKIKIKNHEGEEVEIEQFGVTVRQADKKAPRVAYYAGKFLENVASGLSREIIAEGMIRADDAGIELLSMIHDEVLAEAFEYRAEEDLGILVNSMTAPIPGLPDFPLAAKGFVAKRYRKD